MGFRRRIFASKFGTSPKSNHAYDAGSSPVHAEIVTGYPTAKSTYRLKILLGGPLAVGFRRPTWDKNFGPSPNPTTWTTKVRVPSRRKLQVILRQKYIYVKLHINCRVAQQPWGSGAILPRERRRFKSRTRRNSYRISHGKKYI